MSAYRTEERARGWLCPLAKTFIAAAPDPNCRGSQCAAWRWATTEPWKNAVAQVAKEIGDKVPFPKAARIVADDPAKYDCEGFCGLGKTI